MAGSAFRVCRNCDKPLTEAAFLTFPSKEIKGKPFLCVPCIHTLSGKDLAEWIGEYLKAQLDPSVRLRKENLDLKRKLLLMQEELADLRNRDPSRYK